MAILHNRRIVVALTLLLAATTTTTQARVLQNHLEGTSSSSAVEAFLSNSSDSTSSTNNNNDNDTNAYNPYTNGTPVRYQDQDGTWMDGTIVDFDETTQIYVVEWKEDNVRESFANLAKVDKLVVNYKTRIGEIVAENNKNDDGDETRDWNEDNNNNNDDYYNGSTYTAEELSQYEPWSIGTPVLLEFEDGTFAGTITSYSLSEDKLNATYIATWSDGKSDSFVNQLEAIDLMVEYADWYGPWDVGTPAYGYPNGFDTKDKWSQGEIRTFDNGAYTVQWSNGTSASFSDLDEVDELVTNAALVLQPHAVADYKPWEVGTPVSNIFDSGWWDGTITGYTDGTYEVTYTDGFVKYYSSTEKLDLMVAFAIGEGFGNDDDGQQNQNDDQSGILDDMDGELYLPGTLVYAQFNDGWWAGFIESVNDDEYVVRWSDDTKDTFPPGPDMDDMVDNAQYIQNDFNLYAEGTPVYAKIDGYWYWGTVDYSAAGYHEIVWEDGERTVKMSGDELDEMVAIAYIYSNKQGLSVVAQVAIATAVLGGFAGIAFFVKRRGDKRRRAVEVTEQVQENELDLTEENINKYSDEVPPAVV